jgi:hypothetical protein
MKKVLFMALAFCIFANPVRATPYPVDMRVSDDSRTLKKVYELVYGGPCVDIPRESFKLHGYKYSFVDFIVEPIQSEATFWAIEPVEFHSRTSDINSILSQLEKEIDVSYDNGFSGRIPLNLSSIKVSSLGTGRTSRGVTQTRTFPNLSSADLTHIPKTLDYNGQTLTLTNVQWQSDNTQTIDHRALTDRFSCIATYGGTATSTYSKGFRVTADYQGELRKSVIERVRWTAVFSGTKQFNYWWLTLGGIPLGGAAIFYMKGRKKREKDYIN